MGTVAYFAGSDPLVLSKLVINGINTLPISNGWDNHGKDINHLTKEDNVSCVIGYIHKVFPVPNFQFSPQDILLTCKAYSIPVLLATPNDYIDQAKKLLHGTGKNVKIVTPDDLYDEVAKLVYNPK